MTCEQLVLVCEPCDAVWATESRTEGCPSCTEVGRVVAKVDHKPRFSDLFALVPMWVPDNDRLQTIRVKDVL